MDLKAELTTLMLSRYVIIWVNTAQEQQTTEIVKSICDRGSAGPDGRPVPKSMYCYSITKGVYKYPITPKTEYEAKNPVEIFDYFADLKAQDGTSHLPSVLVLYDMHPFMENNPPVIRRMKEITFELKDSKKNVIIISPLQNLPVELQDQVMVIEAPYPTREELSEVVKDAYQNPGFMQVTGDRDKKELITEISSAAAGLTIPALAGILKQVIVRQKYSLKQIIDYKKQIIQKSKVLEYFDTGDISLSDIGGLDLLKKKIQSLPARFSEDAEKYGLDKPKGFIAIGPPGTGKSLSAKVTASTMGVPLIRISMANIASKWYGESTSNLKNALQLITALAPCVVLFDEIEKLLSVGTGGEAHEETMRMLSELLTFIEETKSPIYFIGTCNDFRTLKPELMQRFEHLVFVDLPNRQEREEIFKIHIGKYRKPENFNLKLLAESSEGFVGREIRVIVKEALGTAFDDNRREVTTEDFLREIRKTVPTAKQAKVKDQIDSMRGWAVNNCMLASSPESVPEKVQTGEKRKTETFFTE